MNQLANLKTNGRKEIQFGDKSVSVTLLPDSYEINLINKKTPQKAPKKEENKAKKASQKAAKTKTASAKEKKQTITKAKQEKPKKEKKVPSKKITEKQKKKEKENIMKNASYENGNTNSASIETKEQKVSSLNEGSFVLPEGVSLFVGEPHERKRPLKKVASKPIEEGAVEKKVDVKRYLNTSRHAESLAKEHNPELLQKAIASELKLNANIHNPTYPVANKIRDLRTQDVLIDDLNEEDQKQLKLTHAEIEKKLKELMNQ